MPSAFETVCDAVAAQFALVRSEFGHAMLPPERWLVGRVHAEKLKALPYIAWIPGAYKLQGPRNMNPIRDGALSISARYERLQSVEVLCCGAGLEEAEALLHDVLEAEHRALGALGGTGNGRWVTQEPERAGWSLGGELVVHEFTWPLIVPKEIKALVTVASQTEECSLIP